ncbi:MAG: hypothetical protein KIT44_10075 [Opitutaceae bacterium]|nr:hypothetical protein [Opitutaceae bacterium]
MMTPSPFLSLKRLGAVAALALSASIGLAQTAASDPQAVRVQITEVGLLRTLVMVDESASDLEPHVINALLARDFSVFQDADLYSGRVTSAEMMAAGERAEADLVVYARVEDRVKDKYGGTTVYEARAVVQAVNRVNGESRAMQPTRWIAGQRSSKPDRAQESARENAIAKGVDAAVDSILARAHKMMVHEAVIVNVFSESALLAIMEYMGKMEGVYHVKRKSFDRQTNEALIEIIGEPRSQTFWRAYLEGLPKTKVNVQVTPNDKLHNKYPDWFLPPVRR